MITVRLHTWVYAADMHQWIPNYTETVTAKINRHGNYTLMSGGVFSRVTRVLISHTPKKQCPEGRWPYIQLKETQNDNRDLHLR